MPKCLKEVCYSMKNVIMNQDFTSRNPEPPLFHGLDFKVFPNKLLMCPE